MPKTFEGLQGHAMISRLLTAREAAQRLRCSVSNVRYLRQAGKLPFVSTGAGGKNFRYPIDGVHQFIAAQLEAAGVKQAARRPVTLPAVSSEADSTDGLDRAKLLAAWRRRGVRVAQPSECTIPTCESSYAPTESPTSSSQPR